MGGTHIPILCPAQATQAFLNCKGYFSIILQGIVDHWGHFTHIFATWEGSAHDAHIFCNSLLPRLMESRFYTPGLPDLIIGDVIISLVIIGDLVTPLLP